MRRQTNASCRIASVIELLESRQLLSAAVHAATAKVLRAHASRVAITNFHKGDHPKGRRLGAARVQAAAAAATPLATGTPTINVGTTNLLPNTPNQIVTLAVTGGGSVTGFKLDAVLGNGTASGAEPKFQAVNFGSSTIWAAHPATVIGGPLASAPQDAQASVVLNTSGDSVAADGSLVTLTIDTTGFAAGKSFPLSLRTTETGEDSQFIGAGGSAIAATVANGTVNIVASPVAGLTDAVYHGNDAYTPADLPANNPNAALTDATFGGDNAAVQRVVAYAGSHTPNYTFINDVDRFLYGGGSGAGVNTGVFLSDGTAGATGDATGQAVTDPADVSDTIFDAQGYFLTPTANDGGTYTVQLGAADDVVAVYIGGNGTPGSGTLVASAGSQGANAGSPSFQITLPAGPNTSSPASIPVEIIYGNGFGNAGIDAVTGSSPQVGVQIVDPHGVQVTSFQTAPTNEPLPAAPTITGDAGNGQVQLTWSPTSFANGYTVYRYKAGSSLSTAVTLAGGLTATSYTDTTVVNGTTYDYYVTADNPSGSSQSNTLAETPLFAPTGPVMLLSAARNGPTSIAVSFTAPPRGTNYTITRSTTLGGAQTTLTPAGGQTGTSYTDTTAQANTSYYYTVSSVNSAGPSTANAVFVGSGDGWAADYYTSDTADTANNGATKPLTGDATAAGATAVLAFERVDQAFAVPPANTPAGFNSIQPNVNNDIAIRWTGYVQASVTGYYAFTVTNADDREQIFVSDPNHLTGGLPTPANISPAGHTMIGYGDNYTAPVVGTDGRPYAFTAGQKYLVQVDYNQGFGGVNANLSWAASSTAANATAGTFDVMAAQAVPTSNVVAPTPTFSTVDASGTVTKDQGFYTINATANNAKVQLQWSNVAADSYKVYHATSQTGPYTLAGSVAATTNGAPVAFTDSGLTNGTKYFFIVTGVTANGETPVNLSNGTTSGLTISATPQAVTPATPTGVVAAATNTASQGVQGHVSFTPVSFADSYIVQRAPETSPGSGTPGTFATVPNGGSVTSAGPTILFADTDPTLSTTRNYFYRVIAVNGTLQSAPSTPAEMTAVGPLASEGTVEVDVRAGNYATGTTNTIANVGNQGGTFNAVGGAISVGPVTDSTGATYQAFQFNGANSATSTFNAPADLTGNSSRSIELWVDNPVINNIEETMVSWSHRGGPDGSNMSFSYGSTYGVGLWGGEYDLTWANTAPGVTGSGAPAANAWHYMAFTYDGTNDDVYVDGRLYLQVPVANGGLVTVGGLPVNLAAQNTAGASGFAAALQGSLDLASVRVSGGALTASDVMNNYVVGVPGKPPATTAPTTAPTLQPITSTGQLTLNWSYDRNATSYNVYRSDAGHPTATRIATNVEALSYTDNAITAGVTYTYYVTSVNSVGEGPASNSQSGSVHALTTAPTLNPPYVGNKTVTLTWTADPNAATYNVYRSDPSNPTPARVATGLKGLTFTNTGLTNGVAYTYYVTSVNSISEGPASNTVTATPHAPAPFAPVNVLTHHQDSTNDGLDASESVLTPTNVNSTDFGKQFGSTLDGGDVVASPLYMQNVNVTSGSSQGVHSVLYVATEADGLYALDANTGAVLWHDNFTNVTNPTVLTPTTGVSTILQSDIAGNPDVGAQLGILATPAVDATTGILYLNANTKEIRGDGKHFVQRLWAIDTRSGAAVMNPTVIGDTIAPNGLSNTGPYTYVAGPIVNGTGNNNPAGQPTPVYPDTDGWASAPGGATGYVVAFNAIEQMERTAVSLINGNIYLGFASHGDTGPYYGWILGYSASTLALNAAFNTTPTYEPVSVVGESTPFNQLGGIWGSGTNISTDGTYLYLSTGNGAFNGQASNFDANGFPIDHNYGDSLLKLAVDPGSSSTSQNGNGWGLKVADYFTPSNQLQLNNLDLDLGSGGITILPDNILDAAGNPMIMVGGKESRLYLIDRTNLGKYNFSYPSGSNANPALYDRVVAEYANNGINNGGQQIYASATYYDGNVYVPIKGQPGVELNIANMVAGNFTPVKTSFSFGYPGATFIASSNADADGVLWAENPGGSDLIAFDPATFTTPIYDSNTVAGDALGGSIHFHVPTVANGTVYGISRGGGIGFYGLRPAYLNSNPTFFGTPTNLMAVRSAPTTAHLTWTSNSSLANEFRIDRSPHGANTWTTLAYVGNSNTSYDDTSVNAGTTYDYRVVAISGANVTAPSNVGALQPPLPAYITASTGAVYAYDPNAGTLSLTAGTLTFTADEASNVPSFGPPLTVSASGANAKLVVQTNEHMAGLSLTDATATLPATAATTLTLGGPLTLSGQGTLDLGKGSLLLPTAANVLTYLARAAGSTRTGGYNAWDGAGGLTSSVVKADAANNNANALAIGYFDSRENATTGLNLPAGDTLVKYTVYGDATADGVDDTADFTVWRNNAFTGTRWSQGDFNYDGAVDTADFTIWRNNFFKSVPS